MGQLTDFDRAVAEFMVDFGTAATILSSQAGSYDVATSEYTHTDVEYTVEAIFMDFTLRVNGLGASTNSLIQEGDKQVFIRPINKSTPGLVMPDLQPNKDRIRVGTKLYKIITAKFVDPSMSNTALIEAYVRE